MIELRWTTKKAGLVLQYRTWTRAHIVNKDSIVKAYDLTESECWTEWTDVLDVNGDYPAELKIA